jgi:hypothetical protein
MYHTDILIKGCLQNKVDIVLSDLESTFIWQVLIFCSVTFYCLLYKYTCQHVHVISNLVSHTYYIIILWFVVGY